MTAFAIVQARMGSSRFPGKSMAEIEGRPILWYLFRQLSFSRNLDRQILATTTHARDDALADYAESQRWDVFRGHETDVLSRYHDAARTFGADAETAIIRCTGDDIWPDPGLIDALIDIYFSFAGRIDCVCTDRGDRLPYGADLELWPFRVLERAHREASDPYDREHVSPYILRDGVRFPRIELAPSVDMTGISLSIDRKEDLVRNAALHRHLEALTPPPYRLGHILEAARILRESEKGPG